MDYDPWFKKLAEHYFISINPFNPQGCKNVTADGPIQKFMIQNITNIDDDTIFSVSGDIVIN